jgi:eukaryotic-like serine/threonine-protein kinase
VLQACEGVAEAHAAGIVHRDLKPENLFLARRIDGHPLVKILDFGISKSAEPTSTGMALTSTQEVIGSPLYMAPEQIRSSRDAEPRSDIWSLGVVLYELLTGALPFSAESYGALVMKVAESDPPPPRTIRFDLPVGLEQVVLRCLDKNIEGRFPNVAELAMALEPFAPDSMRDMPERVRAVLAASGKHTVGLSSRPSARASGAASSRNGTPPPEGKTQSTWAETGRRARKRAGMTAGLVLLLAGGVALTLALRPKAAPMVQGLVPPPVDPPFAVEPAAPPTGTPEPRIEESPPAEAKSVTTTSKHAQGSLPPPPASAAKSTPNPAASAKVASAPPSPSTAPPPSTADAGDLVFQRK